MYVGSIGVDVRTLYSIVWYISLPVSSLPPPPLLPSNGGNPSVSFPTTQKSHSTARTTEEYIHRRQSKAWRWLEGPNIEYTWYAVYCMIEKREDCMSICKQYTMTMSTRPSHFIYSVHYLFILLIVSSFHHPTCLSQNSVSMGHDRHASRKEKAWQDPEILLRCRPATF